MLPHVIPVTLSLFTFPIFPMHVLVYCSPQMPEDTYQTLQMVYLKSPLPGLKWRKVNFPSFPIGIWVVIQGTIFCKEISLTSKLLLYHQFYSQKMSNSYKTYFYLSPKQIQYRLFTTVFRIQTYSIPIILRSQPRLRI